MAEVQGRQYDSIYDPVTKQSRARDSYRQKGSSVPKNRSDETGRDHASPPLVTMCESEKRTAGGDSDHAANAGVAREVDHPPN